MKLLILVALCAFIACAAAQGTRRYPIYDRPCSVRSSVIRPQVKTAFNQAAYSGTWFEIGRYQQRDEPEADCLSSGYSWGFISRSFLINRLGYDFDADESFSREATAFLAFPDAPRNEMLGLLNVTYYGALEASGTNYYVLATDYFQYAVGWACEDIGVNQSREFAWLLSRTPELPTEYRGRVDELSAQFFDAEMIRETRQDTFRCLGEESTRDIRLKYEEMKNKA